VSKFQWRTHLTSFFLVLNLVNPVVLDIILSTWPASCHVFVKWSEVQKQLDHAMGYTFSLISCNVTTMVTNQSKRFILWLFHFATFCLCWIHGFASHLICLSLTKPTMHQCFHPSAKHLLYRYVSPSLAVFLFVLMQVKLGTFLPIHRYAVWFVFNLKYIFVSLCKYNS